MGWRAEWLKRASPEAIAAYRAKEAARVRAWALANPDKVRERKRDPVKMACYNAKWRGKNSGYRSANDLAKSALRREETKRKRAAAKIESYKRRLARNIAYAQKHKTKIDAYKAVWRETNKARTKQRAIERYPETQARVRARRATDIQFALSERLRARMSKALRSCGAERSARTAQLLGCTIDQFRAHLEKQFTKGMNWENRSQWHLDHIRPIASFDLTDQEQQRACFHFTNIRPLWRVANHQKGGRVLLLL